MWRFAFKLFVSALLIWLLLRNYEVGRVYDQFTKVDFDALGFAFGLMAALTIPLALRWSAILGGIDEPRGFRITYPLVMIGLFFSQALPSGIGGDAVRMWRVHKTGIPASSAVSSVVVDRLLGLIALFIIVTVGLPALFNLTSDRLIFASVTLVVLGGYGGVVVAMLLDRLPGWLHRFKVIRGFARVSQDLRRILLSPRKAFPPLAYSLVNQAGIAFAVCVLGKGMGLPVTLMACMLIVPLANLLLILPITIGGWGVRESFFVASFASIGIAESDALALSLLYGLLNTGISLFGGLFWLAQRQKAPPLRTDALEI